MSFLFTIMINLNAQEVKKKSYNIKFGTCIPIVFENLDLQYFGGNDYYDANFQSKLGYYGNLSMTIPFQNNFSFTFGISYKKNELKIERNWTIAAFYRYYDKGTIESRYITIPFSFNYSISKTVPLEIGLGSYIGILIKSEDKGIEDKGIGVPSIHYNNGINSTFFYKKLDFGISVPLKYSFIIKENYSLFTFTEFECGIMNAKKHIMSDDSKWLNLNWILGLGLQL